MWKVIQRGRLCLSSCWFKLWSRTRCLFNDNTHLYIYFNNDISKIAKYCESVNFIPSLKQYFESSEVNDSHWSSFELNFYLNKAKWLWLKLIRIQIAQIFIRKFNVRRIRYYIDSISQLFSFLSYKNINWISKNVSFLFSIVLLSISFLIRSDIWIQINLR